MKTKVIKIGNSQGVRLPKVLLCQIGVDKEVDLEVEKDRIVIKPIRSRRSGWREAFEKMAISKDDTLLDNDAALNQSEWDNTEWEWKDKGKDSTSG